MSNEKTTSAPDREQLIELYISITRRFGQNEALQILDELIRDHESDQYREIRQAIMDNKK